MATSATAQGKSSINFTLIENQLNQTESAALSFAVNLANGTGNDQINYGVYLTGSLTSPNYTDYIDLSAVNKKFVNLNDTVQFSRVHGIMFFNASTGTTTEYDLYIAATGSAAFTKPFNNGTGAALLPVGAPYQYFDPSTGTDVTSTHKEIAIHKASSASPASIDWKMIVVGVTG